ncbi:MAG: hypothetical protein HQK84_07625, partial [Nitrospinae bacterium]|nr:hypothetical protein [Nitrospinota bacterium]
IPCPALEHPKDWCHTEINWNRPTFIHELDELVGNIHKTLKFSYIVISKTKRKPSALPPQEDKRETFRVVSDVMKEKGRSKVFLCNENGRKLFVRQKKHKSPENSSFDTLRRYDTITIENYEEKNTFSVILPQTIIVTNI